MKVTVRWPLAPGHHEKENGDSEAAMSHELRKVGNLLPSTDFASPIPVLDLIHSESDVYRNFLSINDFI